MAKACAARRGQFTTLTSSIWWSPEHKGKYLVLNVETGDYEIDANLAQAGVRMLEKHRIPKGEKPPFFSFHIGYPTTYDAV